MGAYRDLIRADGPSLLLPLDATYAGADQSGNSRNGTAAGGVTIGGFSGGPIASGESATSTDFDGSNDRVTTTYNPFTNGTVRTYEGWAYADTLPESQVLVAGTSTGFHLRIRASRNVEFLPANSAATTWTTAWPASGQWVHWALIFNETADTAELFVNGATQTSKAAADAYPASPGNIEWGIHANAFDPFDGKMAWVAVYERALTASEIQSHYRAGTGINLPADRRYLHQAGRGQ